MATKEDRYAQKIVNRRLRRKRNRRNPRLQEKKERAIQYLAELRLGKQSKKENNVAALSASAN